MEFKDFLVWYGKRVATIAIVLAMVPNVTHAQSSSSGSYRIDQYQFGTGGNFNLNSTNYKGRASTGSLAVGSQGSSSFRNQAGFYTISEEYLEFEVSGATVDLGVLDAGTTGTGTGTFSVRSYLASSYVVLTMSDPLTSESGEQLDGMNPAATPSAGTEQFGINLINNSSPDIGADPVNDPTNDFADGEAASGYDTDGEFKYVKGDIIARSPETSGKLAWGKTDYTISYVANVAPLTKAGLYTMYHDLVVVCTF